MSNRLNEKQIAAIAILSQPKRTMTYEEIAKEVGVAKSTLFEWKKQEIFEKALNKEIVRVTKDRLPDMFDSMIDNIMATGNAAGFRTVIQAHGMLTDKIEIESKSTNTNADDIRAEIERLRGE
ncbi:phBC6A51 family helix-turn-helix protein [Psychrobacillus sp. FSL K6-1415]|uniref:phBC6A51 family helix-turn-helix protein n=1 Tax=Psychrobacillus sp. FSL K6-1415 TaxID=2921544 RepID=UPI0030F9093E